MGALDGSIKNRKERRKFSKNFIEMPCKKCLTSLLVIQLRGDLSECHVTGAKKYNHLCFSVGRRIKKDVRMFYLRNNTKIKTF